MGNNLKLFQKNREEDPKKSAIAIALATLFFFLIILGTFFKAGSTEIMTHSPYDTYTLQAMAWRDGRTDLGKDYPWLELAVINDDYLKEHGRDDYESYREIFGGVNEKVTAPEGSRYYVSFPPVPSVTMYILSFIFGAETPSALVSVFYTVTAFLFAILALRRLNVKTCDAIGVAAIGIFSSSAFFLACNKMTGGVWFQAQTMALMFTMIAFYAIFSENKVTNYFSFAFLALAVGCRPFQILYFVFLAYVIAKKYDFKIFKTWTYYISPAVIGGCYMVYNYVRFKNPLEFGHNYLPEFMRMPDGQFGTVYLKENYKTAFLTFPETKDGALSFSHFGFAFYVSNVIFMALAVLLIAKIIIAIYYYVAENEKPVVSEIVPIAILILLLAAHLFLLMLHKTWGGWQFGSRYVVDLIPAAIVLMGLLSKSGDYKSQTKKMTIYVAPVINVVAYTLCAIIFVKGAKFNIDGVLELFK